VTPKPAPNVRQRRVARRLQDWRIAHGGTQEEIGEKLGWSDAKLSRYERADQIAGPAEIIAIATILGVGDEERDHMVNVAVSAARQDGWWRSYGPEAVRGNFEDFIETEADASKVCNVETMLIPGLLQTPEYADAILRTSQDEPDETVIAARRELRQQRQARLGHNEPLDLRVIIHENALRMPIGGSTVMHPQLTHLLQRGNQSNITLRVLPTSAGAYPHMGTAYHLIYFDDAEAPAVYLENLNGGLYLEEETDVAAYTLNFERLTEAAHDPDESTKLIHRISEEWKL